MMIRGMLSFLAVITALTLLPEVYGNGYDDYPPDLAWSPVADVLVTALENRLVIWTPDEGQATVAEGEVASPAFTPDGKYVAFILDGMIHYFQVDTPESYRQLVHTGRAVDCTFDPLGEPHDPVLCFTTHFLGSDIYVTGLFSGDVFLLLPEYSEVRINGLVISPDGKNIACMNFAWTPGWYEELHIIGTSAPSGRRARADTTFYRWDWHESNPVWITDRVLLFQIGGWGEWQLRFLNIESGIDKVFMDNASQVSAVLDGQLLAFCRKDPFPVADYGRSWEDPTTVWIMKRETGYLRQVSEQGEWATQPALSSDGSYLAWIEIVPDGEVLKVFHTREFI
ncbi:MAG: PD40 domain-containing protein [Candidatus Aegiribacteria sp.]|nr:PD40 domain-containing protein [Candidatus Aegiribacteria sp.]